MASAAQRGSRGIRLRALHLAGAAVVALVLAGTVVGADSITPADQTLNLGVGSTFTLNPTLHLDAAPPKADILLALDTTGSMGAAIADARSDANAIVSDIQESIPGARFAVVDFKDYPPPTVGFGIEGDYAWQVDQDFTTNAPSPACDGVSEIKCALDNLSAPPGSGGDNAESYNRAFYEAYSSDELSWADGASRFMIVLGDSLPHDATMNSDFPACPNTPDTDPGRDGVTGNADDLRTQPTLAALKQNHTNLSFVTYNPTGISWGGDFTTFGCQSELAQYTGGSAVIHDEGTASLENQIVGLVNQAASHVDSVSFQTTAVSAPEGVEWSPSSWVSYNPPPPYGPITAPADVNYELTISVPQDAVTGQYKFDIHAIADGSERAVQHFTVNVTRKPVSGLTLTADESSVPAGIAAAPYTSIPAARLPLLSPDVGSAPAGSIPAGSIPAGSIPAGSIPAGSIPAGSIPAGSIPAGSIPAGSIGLGVSPAGSIPAGSIPAGSIALRSVLLSQIPLVGTTWAQILRGSPFANQPLQAVTLDDIAHYENTHAAPRAEPDQTPWERLSALPLKNVPFLTTLWRNVPFAALMLGNAPLSALPPPKKPDGTDYPGATAGDKWQAAITDNGGSLAGPVDPSSNTVFGIAISGQLGSTPAGSIPAGSINYGGLPAGSIPAGSIPAGSIDIRYTPLSGVTIASLVVAPTHTLDDYIHCAPTGTFVCTGKTLGEAYAASAFNTSLTLGMLFDALPAASPARAMTIDQIVQAMLPVSDYPWEQIKVQGLQDVAGTGQNVHYHVDFDLDCSIAPTFAVHVRLPSGFFPVPGSSKVSYAGGALQTAADPSTGPNGPVWSLLPGSPCNESSLTRHMRLDFTSFAGLTLGSQTSSVDVSANGTYRANDQAPVLVTQNWEPSDDPATAPTIEKNVLVVGHVASSGDVDYFRFSLNGLAPGTKVAAFLKVPGGADLDLVLNKPSAPTIQPNPAGSIPAGSIAIEDSSPGMDNSRSALQPNTLADIPAGSIPAGSIPAGSIPAGSISANRGAVSEAVQIVTRGETGNAIIGVSGYNGAFSTGNYVLRIKVTPPPTLPPCPAVTGLAPTLPTPSTLPASLPASTTALFLVNRQRLAGLYTQARMNTLLTSSSLATVATQVGGAVLPVDGSAAVRAAYAAWDASPCSLEAANAVVRAINGVVAGYRASLPNLKYVVLLGTDQAIPMYRQPDLTSLSPEIDNAQELAFTTNGLTSGNSAYAAAALNAVLTDGAYGAFTRTTFLGHDLPLPQVSVSRLVESPEDIIGQFAQYLTATGKLNLQSALTTGDDFFVDGAQAANDALGAQFPGISRNTLLPPASDWTHQDLLDNFFNKTSAGSPAVPDVGALYAHYNHWLAQPASISAIPVLPDFATTADVPTTRSSGQLLFTIGCHSGLNVADTIASVATADQPRLLDWAQAYGKARTAVYVANTGFGYGDTKTIDLSERLMRGFAQNLNTGGTIGEQWVRALHAYYATAGIYDVVDEKVMVEANMYGLPFYGYVSPGTPPPAPTPPTTHLAGGLDTASLPAITADISGHAVGDGQTLFFDDAHPDGTTYTDTNGARLTVGTLSAIYRPVQPQLSRDVTVPGKAAHGAFITGLTTHTVSSVKPVKGRPLVDSTGHEPPLNFPNIFFPAGLVTVNRDVSFGVERGTAVINMGRFRPDDTGDLGVEQIVDSIGLDIGYSNSTDSLSPQITQTGAVETAPMTFTAFVRVSDDSGSLHRVAVIYNTGDPTWQVKELTNAGGDLWTGIITTTSPGQIVLDAEAQDNAGNVGFSFNKAVNFQSVPDTGAGAGPTISADAPLPNAVFTLHQLVKTNFDCSDVGAVASCKGSSDGLPAFRSGVLLNTLTPGQHTFKITAVDLSGNTTTRTIPYVVRFVFSGFRSPVNNPPVLNVQRAGFTIAIKWTLKDIFGLKWPFRSAVQSISSKAIRCPAAPADPLTDDTVAVGLSGLRVDDGEFQFNWATDRHWAGTCRRLFVGLADGTVQFADFRFT